MKKVLIIFLVVVFLAGCGKKPALETVTDVLDTPTASVMQRVQLQLPPELSAPVMESEETGTLYLCDTYSVALQTVAGGDLEKTIRSTTGMEKEKLQILQTRRGDAKCYQWVWSSSGETGVQVGRGCILDDGAYHYVLTAQADEQAAYQVQSQWREIFASFCLAIEREEVSTGS